MNVIFNKKVCFLTLCRKANPDGVLLASNFFKMILVQTDMRLSVNRQRLSDLMSLHLIDLRARSPGKNSKGKRDHYK